MKLKIFAVVIVALIAAAGFGYGLLHYLKQSRPPEIASAAPLPAESDVAPVSATPVQPAASESVIPEVASVPDAAPDLASPAVTPDTKSPVSPMPGNTAPAMGMITAGNVPSAPGIETIKALQTDPLTLLSLSAGSRVAYLKQILELTPKQMLTLNEYYGVLIEYNRQAMQQGVMLSRPIGNLVDIAGGGLMAPPGMSNGMAPPAPVMPPSPPQGMGGIDMNLDGQTISERLTTIAALADSLKSIDGKRTEFIQSLSKAQQAKLEPYIKARTF